MRFAVEQRIAAPLTAVEEALVDPAFLARLAELPALGSPKLIEHDDDGTTVRQQVRYRFAGDLSPAVLAAVDPAKLTWVEVTTYDRGAHQGEHHIEPDHYARRLRASYRSHLSEAEPGHTVRTIDGEVRVSLPLVAGRVEKAIVSGLTDHAAAETNVLQRWLAERG